MPTCVELINKDTGEVLSVEQDGRTRVGRGAESETSIENLVDKTLYIKERFNVSNQTYHELAMVNKGLPRTSALTKRARELDADYTVCPTPGTVVGVQQSLKEQLKKLIQILVKEIPTLAQNAQVRVKVTGDGTRISHSMHAVIIAFVVVEEGANPNSPRGNHTIAILNAGENYEVLSEALEDIRAEIEQLKSLKVGDVEYSVEFFLGADWKFLALCVGIEAANAKYSCIWCVCPSEDRHDISKVWSITNEQEGARTIEEIQRLARLNKRCNQTYFKMERLDRS